MNIFAKENFARAEKILAARREFVNQVLDAAAKNRDFANKSLRSDLAKTADEIRDDLGKSWENGEIVIFENGNFAWKNEIEFDAKNLINSRGDSEKITEKDFAKSSEIDADAGKIGEKNLKNAEVEPEFTGFYKSLDGISILEKTAQNSAKKIERREK